MIDGSIWAVIKHEESLAFMGNLTTKLFEKDE